MKSFSKILIYCLLFHLLGVLGINAGNIPHRTGRFQLSFDERSPLSTLEEMQDRNVDVQGDPATYNAGDFTYEVVVPESYNPATPMGLFIWISASDRGAVNRPRAEILAKHGFIYIGANKSGNPQPVTLRYGAAIDAAMLMPKLYNIDPDRIVVSGNSGGGRSASMISIPFSDVFTGGGFYLIGCNFWERIPVPDKPGYTFAGFWPKPDPNLIQNAREHPFVFLTGSEDFNRPGTIATHKAYGEAGFENIKFIEVPGMGHKSAPPEHFEEGVVFLNRGLKEKGDVLLVEGIQQVGARNYKQAMSLLQRAHSYGNEDARNKMDEITAEADAATARGLKLLEDENIFSAHTYLRNVVDAFGEDVAVQAKIELDKIESGPGFAREQKAAQIFQQIQEGYQRNGMAKTAEYLNRLITEYPDSGAAKEARYVLERMKTSEPSP